MTLHIAVEDVESTLPVAIVDLEGELDASNYMTVIKHVKEIYDGGARKLILDLSGLSFMSSSGLIALHGITLVMRGRPLPEAETGWGAFHEISEDIENRAGPDENVKLVNPQDRVLKALDMTGFSSVLEIFTNQQNAIAALEAA